MNPTKALMNDCFEGVEVNSTDREASENALMTLHGIAPLFRTEGAKTIHTGGSEWILIWEILSGRSSL